LQPLPDPLSLFIRVFRQPDHGIRTIEQRYRPRPIEFLAIDIAEGLGKQPVDGMADLVGGAVVDLEGPGAAPDIDAERQPGERLPEYPLPQIAGNEQRIRRPR